MKKLNTFELEQVSDGNLDEMKHIGDLIPPFTAPEGFVILSEEFEREIRIVGANGVSKHPITYEALEDGSQILFYR